MIDLRRRSLQAEMMDDLSIDDERLTKSLDQLRLVNRYLGGLSAVSNALLPYLSRNKHRPIRILDIGAGVADIPQHLVQDTGIRRNDLSITAIDLNPATVAYAKKRLAEQLDSSVFQFITVEVADALHLPYADGEFDIAMASMFLHHFPAKEAIRILRGMNRVARDGVLVNDLQRDPLAYESIRFLTRLLPASEMVRHDAPLSVARGFTQGELQRYAIRAGLRNVRIEWTWAFRWVLRSGQL